MFPNPQLTSSSLALSLFFGIQIPKTKKKTTARNSHEPNPPIRGALSPAVRRLRLPGIAPRELLRLRADATARLRQKRHRTAWQRHPRHRRRHRRQPANNARPAVREPRAGVDFQQCRRRHGGHVRDPRQ
jgi:hypothetical protein